MLSTKNINQIKVHYLFIYENECGMYSLISQKNIYF